MFRIYSFTAALLLVTGGALADPMVTFTLDPANGLVQGPAGISVGWGFTISTDSDYVTIESFSFNETTPIGTFDQFVPATTASNGTPITASWALNTSGLQYDINPGTVVGAASEGTITVFYDAFTDPGLSNQVVFGNSVNAQFGGSDVNAEVLVSGATAPATVPEPSAISMLAAVVITLLLFRRRLAGAKAPQRRYGPSC